MGEQHVVIESYAVPEEENVNDHPPGGGYYRPCHAGFTDQDTRTSESDNVREGYIPHVEIEEAHVVDESAAFVLGVTVGSTSSLRGEKHPHGCCRRWHVKSQLSLSFPHIPHHQISVQATELSAGLSLVCSTI